METISLILGLSCGRSQHGVLGAWFWVSENIGVKSSLVIKPTGAFPLFYCFYGLQNLA